LPGCRVRTRMQNFTAPGLQLQGGARRDGEAYEGTPQPARRSDNAADAAPPR
jgi:hypothetical protein